MGGLLYKSFFLGRASLIFLAVVQGVISLTLIILFSLSNGVKTDPAELDLIPCILYYFVFYIADILSAEVFRQDESRPAGAFALSTPLGERGFIRSKYCYVLILFTLVSFCCFITDTLCFGLSGGAVSVSSIIVIIYSFRLFMSALRMPFIVRFGIDTGAQIQGISVSAVIFLLAVYFLFGDISFLFGDDPIGDLISFITEGDVLFILGIFPFVSAAAYAFSCRISERLYRKGAENYE